jgi:hypothetical protein
MIVQKLYASSPGDENWFGRITHAHQTVGGAALACKGLYAAVLESLAADMKQAAEYGKKLAEPSMRKIVWWWLEAVHVENIPSTEFATEFAAGLAMGELLRRVEDSLNWGFVKEFPNHPPHGTTT